MNRLFATGILISLIVTMGEVGFTAAEAGKGPNDVRVLIRTDSPAQLSKSKLTALLDFQPVEVELVAPAKEEALTFAILLDVSGSMKDRQSFEKEYALKLFQTLAVGQNVGFFGDFNDEVYLDSQSATLQSVKQELKGIREFRGGTALRDAVIKAATLVNRSAKATNNRRAVIVFSDGEDESSNLNRNQSVAALQSEGVPVFCVGLLGTPSSRQKSIADLQRLSEPTGGSSLLLTEPHDFISKLLVQIDTQYWVTVSSPASPSGKLHSFSIDSGDPAVKIYAPSALKI